ncbi:MAG: Crp/Fnr family transcriptional regulator [Sphingomicrobium sp.]
MTEVATTEMDRLDAAFAGNRLLATFPDVSRALVEPFGTIVELSAGQNVLDRGSAVEASLFPFGSTMISMVVELTGGRSIEVASIGREGAVGGIVSCGHAPAFSQGRVQVSGPALKLPLQALEDAKQRSNFINHIFCRFSDYLLAQVMQSVACNAFHSIPARAARWLLTAQDRAGDRIDLTQEALAGLLGVQRTTVNAVIRELLDEKLITTGRGTVHVADRAGLTRRACECYRVVEAHFADVIGPSGTSGGGGC